MRTRLDRARLKGNYLEFEDVPLVEFMYLVFTPMPGQVRVGITLNLRIYL